MAGGKLEALGRARPRVGARRVRRRRHRVLRSVLARRAASTPASPPASRSTSGSRRSRSRSTSARRSTSSGPKFHGEVTFEIGPVELTVSFGDSGSEPHYIDYPAFVRKYLEEGPNGAARVLSSITGRGALDPEARDRRTEGREATRRLRRQALRRHQRVRSLDDHDGARSSRCASTASPRRATTRARRSGSRRWASRRWSRRLRLRLPDSNGVDHLPGLMNEPGQPRITLFLRNTGTFPVAVWGLPQNKDAKKVPEGDVINATEGSTIDFHAKIEPGAAADEVRAGRDQQAPAASVRPPAVLRRLIADAAVIAGARSARAGARRRVARHAEGRQQRDGDGRAPAGPRRAAAAREPHRGPRRRGAALGDRTAARTRSCRPPVDYRVLSPRTRSLSSPRRRRFPSGSQRARR